eukprot:m.854294 g.854294  ORF g.854294 m.854294 type:complete len:84 (-) comp59619_c0_seq6:22-273(-)
MMPPATISGLCPASWPAWRSPLDLCTRHNQLHTIIASFSHFECEIVADGVLWLQFRDQSFRDPITFRVSRPQAWINVHVMGMP